MMKRKNLLFSKKKKHGRKIRLVFFKCTRVTERDSLFSQINKSSKVEVFPISNSLLLFCHRIFNANNCRKFSRWNILDMQQHQILLFLFLHFHGNLTKRNGMDQPFTYPEEKTGKLATELQFTSHLWNISLQRDSQNRLELIMKKNGSNLTQMKPCLFRDNEDQISVAKNPHSPRNQAASRKMKEGRKQPKLTQM